MSKNESETCDVRMCPKMRLKHSSDFSHRMFQTLYWRPKASVAFTDVHKKGPDTSDFSDRMFQTRFWTPKTSVAFTDVHKTGLDRLHLPISRVFGHLKRLEPSQVYTKPVPIASIFRFRDIPRTQQPGCYEHRFLEPSTQ